MKKLALLLLFMSTLVLAQNRRFIYEYRFATDSTKMDSLKKELMVLDILPEGSKFQSLNRYKSDSVLADRAKKNPGTMDFKGIKFGLIPFVIEKSYPDFAVFLYERVDLNEYEVKDSREMKWKILPEKIKIGTFETQKAVTTMFGRKWTAWFAQEIPFQDGPYKFHGLPGIIVSIADETNSHIFELKEIRKLSPGEISPMEKDKKHFSPLIKLDENRYKKVFQENRENPTKGIRQMLSSGSKLMMTDEKGKQIDIEQYLRDKERQVKQENKKNNNILELDLLK